MYVLIALALVILVAAGFLILRYMPTSRRMDLTEYYGAAQGDEAVLIIGSEILEEKGRIYEGQAYLPLPLVQERLNPRFYYDEENGQILYTTPSAINRSAIDNAPGQDAWDTGEEIYLRLDYIKRFTDLDSIIYMNPYRVAIQNKFEDITVTTARRKGCVRYLGGIKSEVLTEVTQGQTLLYLEDWGDWVKVATWDGYIGYIEANKVTLPTKVGMDRTFEEEACSYLKAAEPVALAWHNIAFYEANAYLADLLSNTDGMNVICPTWFYLSGQQGDFEDLSSEDYVAEAHAAGLSVWGLLENISAENDLHQTLSRMSSRQALIQGLLSAANRLGLDGINIDFEVMEPETIPHFLEFLRELSIETHRAGIILSVDDPVPESYSAYYRRDEQGRAVDYLIIMGYDEHYDGDVEAGSVASLPWVEQGIIDTVAEVPASRVINAVPFYTRIWRTQNGALYSEVLSMDEAIQAVLANDAQSYWNNDVSQVYASWQNEGSKYEVWVEDADSIAAKTALVKKYNLAGIAAWRLGLESDGIWEVIRQGLQ